jgi:hypothetical protein
MKQRWTWVLRPYDVLEFLVICLVVTARRWLVLTSVTAAIVNVDEQIAYMTVLTAPTIYPH